MISIDVHPSGISFRVRVIPRAGRSEIVGIRRDSLLARVARAPVGGAVNDALIGLLADVLHIPRRDIKITSGLKTRDKRLSVTGISRSQLTQKLSGLLPS